MTFSLDWLMTFIHSVRRCTGFDFTLVTPSIVHQNPENRIIDVKIDDGLLKVERPDRWRGSIIS